VGHGRVSPRRGLPLSHPVSLKPREGKLSARARDFDGSRRLRRCQVCGAAIFDPDARWCLRCREDALATRTMPEAEREALWRRFDVKVGPYED